MFSEIGKYNMLAQLLRTTENKNKIYKSMGRKKNIFLQHRITFEQMLIKGR